MVSKYVLAPLIEMVGMPLKHIVDIGPPAAYSRKTHFIIPRVQNDIIVRQEASTELAYEFIKYLRLIGYLRFPRTQHPRQIPGKQCLSSRYDKIERQTSEKDAKNDISFPQRNKAESIRHPPPTHLSASGRFREQYESMRGGGSAMSTRDAV
jgi:hypothetical protein